MFHVQMLHYPFIHWVGVIGLGRLVSISMEINSYFSKKLIFDSQSVPLQYQLYHVASISNTAISYFYPCIGLPECYHSNLYETGL